MRRILVAFSLILLATLPTYAQDVEYGTPDELKGITKVFVDTGPDMKSRERILKTISKEKLNLVLLDSRDDAEVILLFAGDRETYMSGVQTSPPIYEGGPSTTRPTYSKVDRGAGLVVVPKGNRMRILMDFSGSARFRWTKWPAEQFGKAFVKAYKKANGIK